MRASTLILVTGMVLAPCALPSALAQTMAPGSSAAAFTEVLELLAARRHGHVAFTEVHELAILSKPLTSSGELVYEAPDRLEKRTLEPKPETLLLKHGVLSAQRGRHRYVVELAAAPQLVPFVESLRATLAGDRAALEHYFFIEFQGDVAHWRLALLPRDAALAKSVVDIHIEGARDAIHTVEVRQTDGDRSLLTLGAEIPP